MGFIRLSRAALQEAMLNRLSRLANLHKESKGYRERLGEVRSEMALVQHELEEIEGQLARILAIPEAVKELAEPVLTNVISITKKIA